MNKLPPKRVRFTRQWVWGALTAVALLVSAASFGTLASGDSPEAATTPALSAPLHSPSTQTSATHAPVATQSAAPPPPAVSPSSIQQLYIPAAVTDQTINAPVLPMPSSCQSVIEPPTSGPHVGDVFQCMDFAMPGTATTANTVVAGHSSYDLQTVFNKLYPQGQTLIGRQIFIRTQTSGKRWLAYKVQHVYMPAKSELPAMEEVWRPTPGRLILVTCMQEGGGVSTKNFIVVAQFVDIQDP